nr:MULTISPECIES: MXAN_6627.5 family MYXO-CTERM protein [Myxococcaceae]
MLAVAHPRAALAQVDEEPDAGSLPGPTPDAGEEPPDEDTTGHIVEVCRVTADCSPRFACDSGRCRYQGTREAKRVGCMLGPEGTVALIGLGLVATARRRR